MDEGKTLTVIRVDDLVEAIELLSLSKTDDFDSFWNLYPNKQKKLDARKKWARLSNRDKAAIIADLPKRITTRQWVDGFVPHPTTYLNGRRWEDAYDADEPFSSVFKL